MINLPQLVCVLSCCVSCAITHKRAFYHADIQRPCNMIIPELEYILTTQKWHAEFAYNFLTLVVLIIILFVLSVILFILPVQILKLFRANPQMLAKINLAFTNGTTTTTTTDDISAHTSTSSSSNSRSSIKDIQVEENSEDLLNSRDSGL